MFTSQRPTPATNVIPATVKFKHNKKKGMLEPLSAQEKMLCALRKCLAEMSDKDTNGCRYYIAGNRVQVVTAPVESPAKDGEGRSYRAVGRCRLGVCHQAGHHTTKFIEFTISYRDVVDDRGMSDVVYMDPTIIDELARGGPIDLSALR
jgi:hypothetical protein